VVLGLRPNTPATGWRALKGPPHRVGFHKERTVNDEFITIEVACRLCGTPHRVIVSEDEYAQWKGGAHAHVAFPYLDADEREMLISQTCGTCWHKMFGEWDD
jgi:hypothetical protein